MGCEFNDCLNCKYTTCVLDGKKRTPAKSRKEYQHQYYLMRKEGKKHYCQRCEKECKDKLYKFGVKKFCSMECMVNYIVMKNRDKIQIVDI